MTAPLVCILHAATLPRKIVAVGNSGTPPCGEAFFVQPRSLPMRHVLKSQQFDRPALERLFRRADEMREAFFDPAGRRKLEERHAGEILVSFFYEESTRTRISFETAALRLGIRVVSTAQARVFSSAAKGETLEDTIRVLSSFHPDVIVLRSHEAGGAERAADVSSVPIINAGDGTGQHPTQALLDLYTIQREKGRSDGLTIVIGGDLANGRTARSLAYLLGKFEDVRIIFISPPELRIGADITAYLDRHTVLFREAASLFPALAEADVVYWTRVQKERMAPETYAATADRFAIGASELARMRSDAIILHPLPRVGEIATEVDADPRAAYFRQTENGLFLRMALLEWVLCGTSS